MKSLTYVEAVTELMRTETLTMAVAHGIGIGAEMYYIYMGLPAAAQQEVVRKVLEGLKKDKSWYGVTEKEN